jgi:predicted TPR repeat methyltransferase
MAKTDDDALAEAYNRALSLEKSGDFDLAAAAYAEVLALDPDDHGGAAVRLASMKRGEVPGPRARSLCHHPVRPACRSVRQGTG